MSNYSIKKGLPPGSLIFVGKKKSEKVTIEIVEYYQNDHSERIISDLADIKYSKESKSILWINIIGLHNIEIVSQIGKIFDFHELVLEDILHTNQRPKVEFYDHYLYVVLKLLFYDTKKNLIEHEQISIILGENYVISFQEKEGDIFGAIRDRIKISNSRFRSFGADYLAYALIDIVVDNYFIVLENVGSELERYEEILMGEFKQDALDRIYFLKRENLILRNAVWPLREMVNRLDREDSHLIKKKTQIFLRDLYDHTIQVIDSVEIYRDMLAGLIELYLSRMSNRTNEVMKVLTIISTVFIPLTFLVGVYGMNFKNLPELSWPWAYFALWGLMITIVILMFWYFKRKKWF
jgi:magnesium transporter